MASYLLSAFTNVKDCVGAVLYNFLPFGFLSRKNVSGQVILITGAGNGLGRLMAIELAKMNSILVLWDIDERSLMKTKEMCENDGAKVLINVLDISNRQNVYAAADDVLKNAGKVDILINNAGILRKGGDFLNKDDEMMEKTIQINMISHIWLAKAFLPGMIENETGHIVSICSLAGLVGAIDLVDYSASKFGAVGFQEALENEVHNKGHRAIKFTTICPSFIATEMIKEIPSLTSPTVMKPEEVVTHIIDSILTERRILILPKMAYLLYAAKGLLPRTVFQRVLLWNMNNYS